MPSGSTSVVKSASGLTDGPSSMLRRSFHRFMTGSNDAAGLGGKSRSGSKDSAKGSVGATETPASLTALSV